MSNPVFNPNLYENNVYTDVSNETMSINGTLQITGFMGLILMLSAYFCWSRFSLGYTDMTYMLMGFGGIVGFILAIVISFMGTNSHYKSVKYLIPVYSACEGLLLGGLSAPLEDSYPGIVSSALIGTFAALFAMLALYGMGIIRATEKFRSVIFIATLSILAVYIVDLVGHFFGHSVPILYSTSNAGMLISGVFVVIAALNLIIDFDFIEQCVQRRFPKDYEWYGAFGLMVTIVWLYVEILRLLAKSRRR